MLTYVQLTEKEHAKSGRREAWICENRATWSGGSHQSTSTASGIAHDKLGHQLRPSVSVLTLCKVSVLSAHLAVIKRCIYLPSQSLSFTITFTFMAKLQSFAELMYCILQRLIVSELKPRILRALLEQRNGESAVGSKPSQLLTWHDLLESLLLTVLWG